MPKIYRFIFILLISSLCSPTHAVAKDLTLSTADSIAARHKARLLAGVAVSVDLCGLAMKGMGARFANMEVAARLNFKEKYFPVFELGMGDCVREGEENENHFNTRAPYFRVGMDYNFTKKMNGNRFFGGVRYGFSSFKYDFVNPNFIDEVWNIQQPLALHDIDATSQWAELVVGIETKLWSIVRMGYSVRYKVKIHDNNQPYGEPWYVPGYGRNGKNAWGGTLNLTFDIGKTMRKQTR